MTTTQELIARLRDYEYEGCGVGVTQDAADALEALQSENERLTAELTVTNVERNSAQENVGDLRTEV